MYLVTDFWNHDADIIPKSGPLYEVQNSALLVAPKGVEEVLVSVISGIMPFSVIAVSTSVGYGADFGGLSALLSLLNSFTGGVSMVNIDNGFGAGYMVSMINYIGGNPS